MRARMARQRLRHHRGAQHQGRIAHLYPRWWRGENKAAGAGTAVGIKRRVASQAAVVATARHGALARRNIS